MTDFSQDRPAALDWLTTLQVQVTVACSRTSSAVASLRDIRRRVSTRLDHVSERIGGADDRRERAMSGERHRSIIAAVQQRNTAALTARDRRYAAKQIAELKPSDLRALVTANPSCWKVLAVACLRRWEVFTRLSTRGDLVDLLCSAPADELRFLHAMGRPRDLLGVSTPPGAAPSLETSSLPATSWFGSDSPPSGPSRSRRSLAGRTAAGNRSAAPPSPPGGRRSSPIARSRRCCCRHRTVLPPRGSPRSVVRATWPPVLMRARTL